MLKVLQTSSVPVCPLQHTTSSPTVRICCERRAAGLHSCPALLVPYLSQKLNAPIFSLVPATPPHSDIRSL